MLEVPYLLSENFNESRLLSPASMGSPSMESSDFKVMWNQAGEGEAMSVGVIFLILLLVFLFLGGCGVGAAVYVQKREAKKHLKQDWDTDCKSGCKYYCNSNKLTDDECNVKCVGPCESARGAIGLL